MVSKINLLYIFRSLELNIYGSFVEEIVGYDANIYM
jgi:hypothetical protein